MSKKTAKELGSKLKKVQLGRSSAEADLAIEKQWRASLQVGGCAHVSEYVLVSMGVMGHVRVWGGCGGWENMYVQCTEN